MYCRAKNPCVRWLDAHSEPVTSLDFNTSGSEFMSGSYDGQVRLWETLGGYCLSNMVASDDLPPISSVKFLKDEIFLVSSLDSTHRLFHREAGIGLRIQSTCSVRKVFKGHANTKYFMQASTMNVPARDSASVSGSRAVKDCLVSGSEDCGVYVWDLASKHVECVLQGHTGNASIDRCSVCMPC